MQTPDYKELDKRIAPHLGDEEITLVRLAYRVAEFAHRHQMRDEGTPYITHPLRVALALVDELEIHSPKLICSALLHDVIEDTAITRDEIAEQFGGDIAEIVWLLSKFEDTDLGDYLDAIEAAAHTGAPLVKLCDRLDNLRSLAHSPKIEKKRRYLYSTEHFYLPLAERTNAYLHAQIHRLLEEIRSEVNALNRG